MSSNLGNNDPSNAEEGQCERCDNLDRRWQKARNQSLDEMEDQLLDAKAEILMQKHRADDAELKLERRERKGKKNDGAAKELEQVQVAYVELNEHSRKQAADVTELQAMILQQQSAQTHIEDPRQDEKPSTATVKEPEESSSNVSALSTPAQPLKDKGQTLATATASLQDAQLTTAPPLQLVGNKRERNGRDGPDVLCKRPRLSQDPKDAYGSTADDSGPNSTWPHNTLEQSRRFDSTQDQREYRQQEAMSKPSDQNEYRPSLKGTPKADRDYLDNIEEQLKDPGLLHRQIRELRIRKKLKLEELGLPYHPT